MPLTAIVDKQDNVIWYKERALIKDDELYRVSACRIYNSSWEILLAQRGFSKRNNPWARWPAVAGTIEWNETYLENILHEIPEEIWITLTQEDLIIWPHIFSDKKNQYFTQRYIAKVDLSISAFTKEEWEVEALKRRSQEELNSEIEKWETKLLSSVLKWKEIFEEYMK